MVEQCFQSHCLIASKHHFDGLVLRPSKRFQLQRENGERFSDFAEGVGGHLDVRLEDAAWRVHVEIVSEVDRTLDDVSKPRGARMNTFGVVSADPHPGSDCAPGRVDVDHFRHGLGAPEHLAFRHGGTAYGLATRASRVSASCLPRFVAREAPKGAPLSP